MDVKARERLSIDDLERARLELQARIDATKTSNERNRLGQFATPTALAVDILSFAQNILEKRAPACPIRFLDPAFGSGAFYSALLRVFPADQIARAWGCEIDPSYGQQAQVLWQDTKLGLDIQDFTRLTPPADNNRRANLVICNPPYVRHHHITSEDKVRLQNLVRRQNGIQLNGLAGLYVYFMLLAHHWMSDGGLACWLVPSEFMDVNYGKQIKRYLLNQVQLVSIHRFDPDDVQFQDALVSSAVVCFIKQKPATGQKVKFSYGGTLAAPQQTQLISIRDLDPAAKWTQLSQPRSSVSQPDTLRLSDLFVVKRGLVTGANKFFILTPEQIAVHQLPTEFLTPILPGPRYLVENEIHADKNGQPLIEPRLFLLKCNLPEHVVQAEYPALWAYLQQGTEQNLHNRYICRHRTPWYNQEERPPAPFLCTYMGRSQGRNDAPFRFLLNHSQATAPNVYLLLYPKPKLANTLARNPNAKRLVWQALTQIPLSSLLTEGRVYGGGLHKLEPNELANAPFEGLEQQIPELKASVPSQLQLPLWEGINL
ncbi:MAG: Eco57I restriction-modification methylase domain-containing protein [Anaerolineae bacterium]|nr:Eco57I restriction-modification methylase domain-containing protein [Anaerolineae bacterium]